MKKFAILLAVLFALAACEPDYVPAYELAFMQEMHDFRAERIATAIANGGGLVILVGEVEVSRPEISFSLKNTTDNDFFYGSPWDMARYENGEWIPVPYLTEPRPWTSDGAQLCAGEIKDYRINFRGRFGVLPSGRYMFIREGWQGYDYRGDASNPDNHVFALAEFTVE